MLRVFRLLVCAVTHIICVYTIGLHFSGGVKASPAERTKAMPDPQRYNTHCLNTYTHVLSKYTLLSKHN